MRVLALVLFIAVAPSTAFSQSVTEAKFVLRDISNWLPGTYDNAAQIFVETAFGAGDEGNHPWMHLEIESVDGTDLGDSVYRVTTSRRDTPDEPGKTRLLSFSIDEQNRAVSMTRYDESGTATGATPVLWRRGPDHVYGSLPRSADGNVEFRLTDGELYYDNGQRNDEVPLRLTRVRDYECFALIHHANGDGYTIQNPFTLHDGDGTYRFETEEETPRTFEILLRRSMWTSRSGNNFVPLLQLYLYEDGDRSEPFANAWSAAESGRVGFAARGAGSARCKLAAQGS